MKILFVSPHVEDMRLAHQVKVALGLEIDFVRAGEPILGHYHPVDAIRLALQDRRRGYTALIVVRQHPITTSRLVDLAKRLGRKHPVVSRGQLFVRADLTEIGRLVEVGFSRACHETPADQAIAQALGRLPAYEKWIEEQKRPHIATA